MTNNFFFFLNKLKEVEKHFQYTFKKEEKKKSKKKKKKKFSKITNIMLIFLNFHLRYMTLKKVNI